MQRDYQHQFYPDGWQSDGYMEVDSLGACNIVRIQLLCRYTYLSTLEQSLNHNFSKHIHWTNVPAFDGSGFLCQESPQKQSHFPCEIYFDIKCHVDSEEFVPRRRVITFVKIFKIHSYIFHLLQKGIIQKEFSFSLSNCKVSSILFGMQTLKLWFRLQYSQLTNQPRCLITFGIYYAKDGLSEILALIV